MTEKQRSSDLITHQSRWQHIACYVFIICLLLLALLGGSGYYFLATNRGLKQAINLVNRYSDYTIQADSINGALLHQSAFRHVSVKGKDFNFYSDEVTLDWQPNALFHRSITIRALTLKNSVVVVNAGAGKNKSDHNEYQPFDVNDIRLPFDVRLKQLWVEHLTYKDPFAQKSDIIIDHLQVGIDYVGQVGTIHTFNVRGEGIDSTLCGHIETRADFPVSLQQTIHYHSKAYGESVFTMTINGHLKKRLDVQMVGKGISDFTLKANVTTLLNHPTFSSDFTLQKINPRVLGLADTAVTGTLCASGGFSQGLQLNTHGTLFYQSPQTNRVKLDFNGGIDGEQFTLATLQVGLLDAKQQLTGRGHYRLSDKTIALTLESPIVQYPQQHPKVSAANLQIKIDGKLNAYHLHLNADTKVAEVGTVPLQCQANGSMRALTDVMAKALIGDTPMEIKADVIWSPTLAYTAQIKAPQIMPTRTLPGIKGLDIRVTGDDNRYHAKGGFHSYADDMPPMDIRLDVNGTPQYLNHADVTVNTLGGIASMRASGGLSPLAIRANVSTQHIQPHRFFPKFQGDINSEVSIVGKQDDKGLSVTTTIDQLTGQFNGMPISGKGQVMFRQAGQDLKVKDLAVNWAGNTLNAKGHLALNHHEKSNFFANIDAQQLNTLVPDLTGRLAAQLHIKGDLETPEINGNLAGQDLRYQHHRIHRLNGEIVLSLASDTIAIQANASDITSGENRVDHAKVSIDGKVSQHQIKAEMHTPETGNIPSLRMAGRGGIHVPTQTWSGHLQQLNMESALAGKWQLATAVPLTVSFDTVKFNALCLHQQTASLCADGALQQKNGQFKIRMTNFKTKRLAQWLPETVKLDTTCNANADIVLLDGQPDINGQISVSGGRLTIFSDSGQLDEEIERFENKFSLKNKKLNTTLISQISHIGTLHVTAELPDITQKAIKASIKINTPRLDFLEELFPQLNHVQGSLTGDMTLSGVPDKQLDVSGKVALKQTNFNVPKFGTQIRAMTLDIFSQHSRLIGFKGGASAGGGRIDIFGHINPSTRQGEIDIKGKNCKVADSRKLKAVINPDLQIVFTDTINVRGEIVVPNALIVPERTDSKITASQDVVLAHNKGKKPPVKSPIDVEVNIKLGDDVRVAGADIDTRLLGGMMLIAKPGKALTANGQISIQTGALRVYGRPLNIKRGRVIFSNGPIANPAIDLRAIRKIDGEDVTVGINVLGHINAPKMSLFSNPEMPDSSILSYLLFGKPPNSNTVSAVAVLQTGGMAGINSIAHHLQSSTGLDVLEMSFSGVEAGKHLTPKIYVGVHSNFFEAINQFLLKYRISGNTRVEASIGTDGISTDGVKEIETD